MPAFFHIESGLQGLGRYGLFVLQVARAASKTRPRQQDLVEQMVRIGVESLGIVMLAGVFTGVVLTVQTAYLLETSFLAESTIGAVVVPTLMLELSVLITALVMASRVGAGIAAELGNMRVTEQIDALEAMGLNAVAYLVIPRVLAGVLMFPTLYVAACATGIASAALAGEGLGYLSAQAFVAGARAFFLPFDPVYGLAKSAVFGFVITSIACWKGFNVRGGAEDVGRSTTQAVELGCVAVLIANYLLATLLL